MLIERLLILALVIVVGVALYAVWRFMQARRLQRLGQADAPEPVRRMVGEMVGGNGPAILYFTSEDCTQCRYRQTPILNGLSQDRSVPVHTVDAPSQGELVRHYGIMTVPSTVVLNEELRPAAINQGLADLSRLRAQLDEVYSTA